MEPPVDMTQTGLFCYALLPYEIRRETTSTALRAKGQCGHFLPCRETSKLMREIAVPSQGLLCYSQDSSLPQTVLSALAETKKSEPSLKDVLQNMNKEQHSCKSCLSSGHMILKGSQIKKNKTKKHKGNREND